MRPKAEQNSTHLKLKHRNILDFYACVSIVSNNKQMCHVDEYLMVLPLCFTLFEPQNFVPLLLLTVNFTIHTHKQHLGTLVQVNGQKINKVGSFSYNIFKI